MSRFEWIVALRYLRAKRKQTVISIITVISILGVGAGVMALIIALAINDGFQSTLQASLLSATAHVSVLEKNPAYGIEHWERLAPELRKLPHVISATPGLYGQVALKGPILGSGAVLKGIPGTTGAPVPQLLKHLKQGSTKGLDPASGVRGIILGSRLAEQTGLSKRTVQDALGHLAKRGLISIKRAGRTEPAIVEPLFPWRRSA